MSPQFEFLKGIVFDLAGTTVDYGSCAPAAVFQEIFRRRGVEVSAEQAREPMGKAKWDHIWSVLQISDVADKWSKQHGCDASSADVDSLYEEFLPLQKEVLSQHDRVIAGVPDTVAECRRRGLKVGATTGYTRELLGVVLESAKLQGFEPEFALGAEDAPRGRPAPFMLFELAKLLDIFPMSSIVKVDDTPVGIEAGRNAGCWTIGVTRTGNCVGLSEAQWSQLDISDQQEKLQVAETKLRNAGADAIIESVSEICPVLESFDSRMKSGESPAVGA